MSVPASIVSALTGYTAARQSFKQSYEIAPIFLLGGIAGSSYTDSKLISAVAAPLEITFIPMVGGKFLSWQPGTYPFAIQSIAANAMIAQPLPISMLGICPADSESVGYISKSNAVSNFMQSLSQHINLGGLFGVMTPAFTWTPCLLTDISDVSDGTSLQTQWKWRFDFLMPLLTLQQALQAENQLMSKLSSGAPMTSNSRNSSSTSAVAPASVN